MHSFPWTICWISSSTGRLRASSAKHHSSSAINLQPMAGGAHVDRHQRYSRLVPQNLWVPQGNVSSSGIGMPRRSRE